MEENFLPSKTANRSQRWKRRLPGKVFEILGFLSISIGLIVMVALFIDVFRDGAYRLLPCTLSDGCDFQVTLAFLTSFPSRKPEDAGIASALVGSIFMIAMMIVIVFPVGVGAAIYLEEYAPKNWLTDFIQINIANLAGVPSIIYGLLGLQLFVRFLFDVTGGRSVLSGSLTMALLVMPIILVASSESIKAVPNELREASMALGATKLQTITNHILPYAFPGVLTGTILAISRAIGETAPLITIGALTFIAFLPEGPTSPFTALPIQIFNWVSRPQPGFYNAAAAGIIVLLFVLLSLNATTVIIRDRFYRQREQ